MEFSATPIRPHIGSRVELDRHALADGRVVARLKDLLEQRGVLVFPRLGLTDAGQLALTDRWGTRINLTAAEGDAAAVYRISLEPKQAIHVDYVKATYFWHMDGLTAGRIPPKATLLAAKRVATKGGQTEFANTYLAYERLPAALKAEIDGLRVVHSMRASMFDIHDLHDPAAPDHWWQLVDREHPLVWQHRSGRKSLVLAATASEIVGMPRPEGRALLARLLQWTVQPDFCYSHQWQAGDLVIWDNCGTLHRVIPYTEGSGRLMHRTTIEGVEPLQ